MVVSHIGAWFNHELLGSIPITTPLLYAYDINCVFCL